MTLLTLTHFPQRAALFKDNIYQGFANPNPMGGYNFHNAAGHATGHTQEFAGTITEHGSMGEHLGFARPNLSGGFDHFDAHGIANGSTQQLMDGFATHHNAHGQLDGCIQGAGVDASDGLTDALFHHIDNLTDHLS